MRMRVLSVAIIVFVAAIIVAAPDNRSEASDTTNDLPTFLSLSPQESTLQAGDLQTFSTTFRDLQGADTIAEVRLEFRAPDGRFCLVRYRRDNRTFGLLDDSGRWLNVFLPSAEVLQNDLCRFHTGASGPFRSEAYLDLPVDFTLSFTSAFEGFSRPRARARDASGWGAWRAEGGLTVLPPNAPPRLTRVLPVSSYVRSGDLAQYTLTFTDPDGVSQINRALLRINFASGQYCTVEYRPQLNRLRILRHDGWIDAGQPGAGPEVESEYCRFAPAETHVDAEASTLTVRYAVRLTAPYIYTVLPVTGRAWDAQSSAPWTPLGSVVITPADSPAPSVVHLTRETREHAAGAPASFVVVYHHPDGSEQITEARVRIDPFNGRACLARYVRETDSVEVYDPARDGWISGGVAGSDLTVASADCDLGVLLSRVVDTGNLLIVRFYLTLGPGLGFSAVYGQAWDATSTGGPQLIGSVLLR